MAFYEDDDTGTVYACVGPMGFDAIYRLMDSECEEARWQFLVRHDDEWDAVHQMIYRNFRASQLESADMPPDTPTVPVEPPPIKKMWPSESGEVGAADYPSIAAFLRHQPDQSADLYIALYEDTYETSTGDGEFHYFKKAFTDEASAQAYINDHTDGWMRWRPRTLPVKCVGSRLTWMGYKPQTFDHYTVEQVLAGLEETLRK
mgnify:CR=1 FL=1